VLYSVVNDSQPVLSREEVLKGSVQRFLGVLNEKCVLFKHLLNYNIISATLIAEEALDLTSIAH